MLLSALSAIKAGYEVFAVTDASGTFSKQVADAANTRMAHSGVQLMNWFSVACELQRDWRNDVEGFGNLLASNLPGYQNIIGSYRSSAILVNKMQSETLISGGFVHPPLIIS